MSFETSDRDYGHYLLGEDIDIEAQLRAIRVLLHRQRADEEATAREIREIEHVVDIIKINGLCLSRLSGSPCQRFPVDEPSFC